MPSQSFVLGEACSDDASANGSDEAAALIPISPVGFELCDGIGGIAVEVVNDPRSARVVDGQVSAESERATGLAVLTDRRDEGRRLPTFLPARDRWNQGRVYAQRTGRMIGMVMETGTDVDGPVVRKDASTAVGADIWPKRQRR